MVERRRGIHRIPITEEDVILFSIDLAKKVKDTSEWRPNTVIGIDFGGSEVGQVVAYQLKCSFENILVRRRFVSWFDIAVARYPQLFVAAGVPTQIILSTMYHLFDPVVLKPIEREFNQAENILLVDDSIGKGPTLRVAREHLLQCKADLNRLRTAVVQVHQEYSGPMPDYYCFTDNRRFPWDKASIVYEYITTGTRSPWAEKRLL